MVPQASHAQERYTECSVRLEEAQKEVAEACEHEHQAMRKAQDITAALLESQSHAKVRHFLSHISRAVCQHKHHHAV